MKEFAVQYIVSAIMKVQYLHEPSYSTVYERAKERIEKDLASLPDNTLWDMQSTFSSLQHEVEYTKKQLNKR
tara:strand:- start:229 stop:444 length:216 start_codon:yes stop_codon:yes gene_type:complete